MANEKRLIDAMSTVTKISKRVTPLIAQGCHPQRVYAEILKVIAQAPTVDAVEVVHGRWVDEYPYVRCSECNAEWVNCRTDNEPSLFYYCPNCGADMRGNANEK